MDTALDQRPPRLGSVLNPGCWIGAGARILTGTRIGDHARVAAGAVVTRGAPFLH